MTKREFLTAVMNIEGVDEELVKFASEEIAKLDNKNEKRKTTLTATQKQNLELAKQIVDLINERKTMVASDVAQVLEISTQKASAILVKLVEQGTLVASETKAKGKGKVKSYAIA